METFLRYVIYPFFALILLFLVSVQHYTWVFVLAVFLYLFYSFFLRQRNFGWKHLPNIFTIVLVGALLRTSAILIFGTEQFDDFEFYRNMATGIRNGDPWLSLEKQSGPALMYALASFPFHSVVAGGISLNLILQVLDIFLVYRIGFDLGTQRFGRFAALFLAFFPDHIYYTRLLSSEVFFSTGMLLSLWLLIRSHWKPALFIILGFVLGAMNYFRPQAVLVLAAVMSAIWLSNRDLKLKLKSGLVIMAFLLTNMPLLVFNYHHLGLVSVFPAQISGLSMLFATTNTSQGSFQLDQYNMWKSLQNEEPGEHSLVTANRKSREIAWDRIRDEPGKWLAYTFTNRLPLQFGGSSIRWAWKDATAPVAIFHLLSNLFCTLIMLTFIAQIFLKRNVSDDLYYFVPILLIVSVLVGVFTEVNPRYNHHLVLAIGLFLSTRPLGDLNNFNALFRRKSKD